jgi:hypothetical protein
LRVVPVAPGRTLGALFCARYEAGSTLQYHELAIAPALTRIGYRAGFWISHIYVDSPASVLGGRSIWSLPKQLARFEWQDGSIEVFDGPARLCGIRWRSRRYAVPVPLILPVFSERDLQLYHFSVRGHAAAKLCSGSIEVGPGCPFASFGFQSAHSVFEARLHARIATPHRLAPAQENPPQRHLSGVSKFGPD